MLLIVYGLISYRPHIGGMGSVQRKLGRNVKILRENRGWSQEELADISGLHRTYISGIERGARNPTIEVVQRLAEALRADLIDLFKEREGE